MTEPRSRALLATGAAVLAATGLMVGCGGHEPVPNDPGARTFFELDCKRCHGADRQGTRTAPPLVNLAARWQADDLVTYIKDPQAVTAANPLISQRNEQYLIMMPKYDYLDDASLAALAGFLLAD